MPKIRVALIGVLVVLGISGTATSTASAVAAGPYWRVGGVRLGQGETKQLKLQLKGKFVFKYQIK
jgi:hypothetical protein